MARGVNQTRGTSAEAGTRRGRQKRATEAGGWQVGKKSRWKIIHARRGCGERVRESGEATLKAADGRAVGRIIHKTTDTGGAGRVTCELRNRVYGSIIH